MLKRTIINLFRSKKAQGIVEFFVIFGVVLFFFTGFMIIIQQNVSDKNVDKERILAQEIALNVKSEISLATESSDGYIRNFYVPTTLIGKNYNISIIDNSVYLYGPKIGVSFYVNDVVGNITKGDNTIQKQNGTVYLNI